MPIVRFIKNEKQNPSAMKGSIDYCLQKFKTLDNATGKRYVSGINCNGYNAYQEFMTTKFAYNANNGRYFYQYIQSFSPNDNIDYDKAHKIASEFAQKAWQGHEVLVTTHCDRNHIHSHFIINSVNFETGKKLRQSPNTLNELRKLSDEICLKYGVESLKPYTKAKEKGLSDKEYRVAIKGESWKFALMYVIDNAMKKSGNKKDFIDEMQRKGYKVLWTDERKYITYTCPNGMKCRDIKLHELKYRKEKMEYEFTLRQAEERQRTERADNERIDFDYGRSVQSDNSSKQLLGSTDWSSSKSKQVIDNYAKDTDYTIDNEIHRQHCEIIERQDRKSTDTAVENDNINSDGTPTKNGKPSENSNQFIGETGWKSERKYYFSNERTGLCDEEIDEEVTTTPNWHTNSNPSPLNDSLYFVGNLFEMIDNQKRFHRKHIKLTQKEIAKRRAHGQKTSGEDGFTMSM
jgi:hypothetical protein